jgi:hypothetical protein
MCGEVHASKGTVTVGLFDQTYQQDQLCCADRGAEI